MRLPKPAPPVLKTCAELDDAPSKPENCSFTYAESQPNFAPPPAALLSTKRTWGLLNSGLVVLSPSKALHDRIVHHLHTSPTVATMALPDQDLLGEVFAGRWTPLPWRMNALKTFRWVHPKLWFVEREGGARVEGRERNQLQGVGHGIAVLHYIVEKPVCPHEVAKLYERLMTRCPVARELAGQFTRRRNAQVVVGRLEADAGGLAGGREPTQARRERREARRERLAGLERGSGSIQIHLVLGIKITTVRWGKCEREVTSMRSTDDASCREEAV